MENKTPREQKDNVKYCADCNLTMPKINTKKCFNCGNIDLVNLSLGEGS